MAVLTDLKVADECWIALATLHQENPARESFSAKEILAQVSKLSNAPLRPGVQPHIALHNVANLAPNPAQYRLFYRRPDKTFRLFRPGDDYHANRNGKTKPSLHELPSEFVPILEWYETIYCRRQGGSAVATTDPVVAMRGIGNELWRDEAGDAFIARERSGWDRQAVKNATTTLLADKAWMRILAFEGETFQTVSGLSFAYQIEGGHLGIVRDGRLINRVLGKKDIEKALSQRPLRSPSEINDAVNGPAYVFALLSDPRVKGEDW